MLDFGLDSVKGEEGLGTNLRRKHKTQMAPSGSTEVESFLTELERMLITELEEAKETKSMMKAMEIKRLQTQLKGEELVVILMDKTNSFRVVPTDLYKKWVHGHLTKSAKEVTRYRLTKIFEQGEELLDKMRDMLSKNEAEFIEESLQSRAIPTPKLLIRHHKNHKMGNAQQGLRHQPTT